MTNEFSVWWWDRDGGQHEELRFVEVERAFNACRRLIHGPASVFGFVDRVIITDGGDCTCFEWKKDLGVTWPTPQKEHQQ